MRQKLLGLLRRLASVIRRDGGRWLVMLLGIVMIGLGALVPGTHSEAIAVLVLVGAGLFVVGALLPWFKEVEIGLKAFRLTQRDQIDAAPWLKAEETTLGRVAELIIPDGSTARRVVEETIEAIQAYIDPITPKERATTTFRTLVSFLERAHEELWIDGRLPISEPTSGIEALQLIDFPARMAYVLRNQGLQEQEVSEILNRSPEDIEKDHREVRSTIKPYVEGRGKPKDV
jgi:hypothetical protein